MNGKGNSVKKAAAMFGGVEIDPGFRLTDSRSIEWEFVMVTKAPDPGGPSTGKVLVKRPCVHAKTETGCLGAFCRGEVQREFYPSVFGLELKEIV